MCHIALVILVKAPRQAVRAAPLCLQDKKDALREEQVQAAARLTELESLLSTNLLKQQQELAEKLSNANVEADRRALYCAAAVSDRCTESWVYTLYVDVRYHASRKSALDMNFCTRPLCLAPLHGAELSPHVRCKVGHKSRNFMKPLEKPVCNKRCARGRSLKPELHSRSDMVVSLSVHSRSFLSAGNSCMCCKKHWQRLCCA